jgi:hypothetical protein
MMKVLVDRLARSDAGMLSFRREEILDVVDGLTRLYDELIAARRDREFLLKRMEDRAAALELQIKALEDQLSSRTAERDALRLELDARDAAPPEDDVR